MADSKQFSRDHFADVTNRILAALESGTPPWRRPWDSAKAGIGGPVNAINGHHYRGINVLLLGMAAPMMSGNDPRWLSFKQSADRGWRVRRGERASIIFFFKKVEMRGAGGDEDVRTVPVLRSFPVFHASQVDGVPVYVAPTPEDIPWRTPQSAAVIVARSGAIVREGGDKAFYAPLSDSIQMPPRVSFSSTAGWAATMLHELGHWSGHPSRLNRDLGSRFGTQEYALEELRAELASAYIGAELGIPVEITNHASYIQSWLDVLRRDKREIFRASADAQKIADYLLALHPLYYASRMANKQTGDTGATATSPPPWPASFGPMPQHIKRNLAKGDQPVAVTMTQAMSAPEVAPAFRPK